VKDIKLRPLRRVDLPKIDEIYRKHHAEDFGLPSLQDSITHAVAHCGDEVIGFGMVARMVEAIMVLDLDLSKRDRAKMMRELMKVAIMDAKQAGFEYLHMFVSNPAFAQVLKKHYGAQACSGEALVIKLSGEKDG